MKKIYSIPIRKSFLVLFFLICSATAFSQKKVSGKVTDGENNSSVPGATVQVKGTNKGVTTNAEGSFTIEVPNNAMLIFSSVGYSPKEVSVGNQSIINILLSPDAQALSEVVVTGYGSQRKKDITGAVTVVSAKELTALPAASVTQMLQGRAAGVTVGNDNSPGGGTMVTQSQNQSQRVESMVKHNSTQKTDTSQLKQHTLYQQ